MVWLSILWVWSCEWCWICGFSWMTFERYWKLFDMWRFWNGGLVSVCVVNMFDSWLWIIVFGVIEIWSKLVVNELYYIVVLIWQVMPWKLCKNMNKKMYWWLILWAWNFGMNGCLNSDLNGDFVLRLEVYVGDKWRVYTDEVKMCEENMYPSLCLCERCLL